MTSSPPFKPGDKVICIDPYTHYVRGAIYTVREIDRAGRRGKWNVYVGDDLPGCYSDRFELMKSHHFKTLYEKLSS